MVVRCHRHTTIFKMNLYCALQRVRLRKRRRYERKGIKKNKKKMLNEDDEDEMERTSLVFFTLTQVQNAEETKEQTN